MGGGADSLWLLDGLVVSGMRFCNGLVGGFILMVGGLIGLQLGMWAVMGFTEPLQRGFKPVVVDKGVSSLKVAYNYGMQETVWSVQPAEDLTNSNRFDILIGNKGGSDE